MNFWQQLASEFDIGPKHEAVKDARGHLQNPVPSDWQWLEEALKDEQNKWFVAAVFKSYPVPKRLVKPFLQAAINETNPSFNRQFVEPVIESFGNRRVNEYLLDVVERGDDKAIAGGVAAFYWANMKIAFAGEVPKYTLEYATPESRARVLELKDVWDRKRETYLRVFVFNENVTVRRQVIPSLNLDEESYSLELKPLVQQAIEIARSHPDEYIRHRVEVQLGNERLLLPIPVRSKEDSEE